MSKGSIFGWILLAALVTVIVGFLDVAQIKPIWRQYRSSDYQSVEATVLKSSLAKYRGSKGSISYGLNLSYRYSVGDRTFTSSQSRYNIEKWRDQLSAERALSRFTVGNKATAYVNPDNPSDSVISAGISSYDLMQALTMLPIFNILAVFLWQIPLQEIVVRVKKQPAGGVPIRKKMLRTHVQLATVTPLSAMLLASIAASPIATAVGIGTDFHPSFAIAILVWVLMIVSAIGVFVWQKIKLSTGIQDLVIDENAGTLTLPANCGRKENFTIARDAVVAVSVIESMVRTSKGGQRRQFSPTLKTTEQADEAEYRLIAWSSERKATLFTEWLAQELGVPFPGIEEKTPHLSQKVIVRKSFKFRL